MIIEYAMINVPFSCNECANDLQRRAFELHSSRSIINFMLGIICMHDFVGLNCRP